MFIPLPTQPSSNDRLPWHKYTYVPNLINYEICVQLISQDYNETIIHVYLSYKRQAGYQRFGTYVYLWCGNLSFDEGCVGNGIKIVVI